VDEDVAPAHAPQEDALYAGVEEGDETEGERAVTVKEPAESAVLKDGTTAIFQATVVQPNE